MAKDKITLEDLLSLKRAEQPTDAQWREFDARLQDKLLSKFVVKQSLASRISAALSSARAFTLGTAALAGAAAIIAPIYVAENIEEKSSDTELRASATPLPSIDASYASNELLPTVFNAERPIEAQLSVSDANVRYVSTTPVAAVFSSY